MHILLIGATGQNGQLILKSALAHSHTVTAIVRNASSPSLPQDPNLTIIAGSVSSQSDLENALRTPQPPSAVIFALGHRRAGSSPFSAPAPDSPHDLFETSIQVLISTIKSVGFTNPPKLVINSSQGVGPSWKSMAFPVRAIFSHSPAMKIGLADHARMDAIVRESGLRFVLARPSALLSGPVKDIRVWPEDGNGAPWISTITRESLAVWLVDAAEKSEWDGTAPVITN
ncbi:hypothetical protein EDB81DRAFT_493180 [Dactylonectria macrodidyma]|uniref:NAD(P)-binding domain-containing protein n=1 Tax=Dactylonectria macrodidyma TaxID=307937 RepID=A0A9P9EWT7_9HYPO|nr:hypothetical protein EDB81DRAFT_493180 [Dactylonectria macrodidyma]